MAVTCPQCGHQYDVTLFSFDRALKCDCGRWFSLIDGHTISNEAEEPGEANEGEGEGEGDDEGEGDGDGDGEDVGT